VTACLEPVAFRDLVDYWARDLDEASAERVEEHLFGCAACTESSAFIARLAQTLKRAVPPILSDGELEALKARGLLIEENTFTPGERKQAVFRPGVDVLVHRLSGLALRDAERVSVLVLTESTGQPVFEDHFVPFDPARGEVLIACQRHFAVFPPDVVFEVRAHRASGDVVSARFFVPHQFGV
jgi:hypothetical protein